MDVLSINRLVEELIKDFETSETHSILFYSNDKTRDFKLLTNKVNDYRKRLNTLLAGNGFEVRENRDSIREEDLSKELL